MGVVGKATLQSAELVGIKGQVQIQAVNQGDGVLATGIHAPFHQVVADQRFGADAQPPADRRLQVGGAVVEGQLEFAEAQHGSGAGNIKISRAASDRPVGDPGRCRRMGLQKRAPALGRCKGGVGPRHPA